GSAGRRDPGGPPFGRADHPGLAATGICRRRELAGAGGLAARRGRSARSGDKRRRRFGRCAKGPGGTVPGGDRSESRGSTISGATVKRMGWLVLASASVALAADRGSLAGLVQDSTGGALAAAGVVAMDQDSGVRRSGRTDGEGGYAVFGLPPGSYKITVRKP